MRFKIHSAVLYTNEKDQETADEHPWRIFLESLSNSNDIAWAHLNYSSNLEDAVSPLNTWLDADQEPLTVNSFPFFMYVKFNLDNPNARYKVIVHKSLDELKSDQFILNYKTP